MKKRKLVFLQPDLESVVWNANDPNNITIIFKTSNGQFGQSEFEGNTRKTLQAILDLIN